MNLMCLNIYALQYSEQSTAMKFVVLVVIAFNFCFVCSMTRLDLRRDLRRQVIFNYIGNCPRKMNLPVIFGNFSIDQIGKNEYVAHGQFELKIDFPEGFKGISIIVFKSEKKILIFILNF